MLDEIVKDLQTAAKGVITDAALERGSRWFLECKTQFPIVYELITGLLYKPPGEVLKTLAVFNSDLRGLENNPHVLFFIAQLQQRLRSQGKGKRHDKSGTDKTIDLIPRPRRDGDPL
jgi:predicted nucleic acid-binding protein